jgi:hypothetical protein
VNLSSRFESIIVVGYVAGLGDICANSICAESVSENWPVEARSLESSNRVGRGGVSPFLLSFRVNRNSGRVAYEQCN